MIKLLDKNTISEIQAGEVIERPLNIVKELIENAIDAKSTRITIEIKGGGIDYIKVKDNGSGIEKDDMDKVFLNHATSKIEKLSDLYHIQSFGFRGEALSSIGSVSNVKIVSKTAESDVGYSTENHFGNIKEITLSPATDGTVVIAENLFDNIPARKKFLKTASVEASKIRNIVEKIALSHKEISFKFVSDNNEKFSTSGDNNLKNIIYNLYGKETYDNLIPVENEGYVKITGYIAKPIIAKNNRNDEIFFVNGRYVENKVLYSALENAYKEYLLKHKFPFAVINIDIDPKDIDVNVHPQKMQVKFSDEKRVFDEVFNNIYNILKNISLIHSETFDNENIKDNISVKLNNINDFNKIYDNPIFKNKTDDDNRENIKNEEVNIDEIKSLNDIIDKENQKIKEKESFKKYDIIKQESFINSDISDDYIFIGQVFDTYILIEYKEKLYIIDQHAAHEKIYYEKYINELKKGDVYSQKIMPIIITLNSEEHSIVEENLSEFKKAGFDIELFGDKDIIIEAVPYIILNIGKKDLLYEMIEEFSKNKNLDIYDSIKDKIASVSCKKAVKGNHKLSLDEAKSLVSQLFKLENPYNCPHGRPIIIEISKKEMEKKFGRIVT